MIVVVDYGMGNLGSIMNMFRRIGVQAIRSGDPGQIGEAKKLVLPGVGAFDRGMVNIREKGLREALDRSVLERRIPTLGICLGMQLLGTGSEEGRESGLGWIDARAIRFRFEPDRNGRVPKVPQMGWNYVRWVRPHAIFADLGADPRFYFVHSYHVTCESSDDVLATAHYGDIDVVAAVARENVVGVQFHPEKSHRFGIALFRNFAAWVPAGEWSLA